MQNIPVKGLTGGDVAPVVPAALLALGLVPLRSAQSQVVPALGEVEFSGLLKLVAQESLLVESKMLPLAEDSFSKKDLLKFDAGMGELPKMLTPVVSEGPEIKDT